MQDWACKRLNNTMNRFGLFVLPAEKLQGDIQRVVDELTTVGQNNLVRSLTMEFETRPANDNERRMSAKKDPILPHPDVAYWLSIRDALMKNLGKRKALTLQQQIDTVKKEIEDAPSIHLEDCEIEELRALAKEISIETYSCYTKSQLAAAIKGIKFELTKEQELKVDDEKERRKQAQEVSGKKDPLETPQSADEVLKNIPDGPRPSVGGVTFEKAPEVETAG